ncbi:MAG TPA: branched-chain amino acid ABC transporter substrate-binding protein [Thermomicrobiales bacterium]|jgi:branched-chain amino acid transport system substrate-binding protein|nr:branched-chain amino acid ABC transporter substrate-binding protein [Thermomicrobiales bacterium]
MGDRRLSDLIEGFRTGRVDRRNFVIRATALGLSASTIGGVMRAAAQDASPDAAAGGELSPETIGMEGIPHSTDTSKGTINLYSSWPMSGASEQIGGDCAASVQLAVDLWGGAAGGFAINYTPLDDGLAANNGAWDGAVEAENCAQVLNDEDAVAYIATFNSGAAEVAIPIMNEGGMGMISPANTAIQLTKEHPTNPEGYPDVLYPTGTRNYMRVVPSDDLQGAAGANHAFNELGRTRAFVLHDNQTYGKGVAQVFSDTFEELGGEVLGFEAFDPNAPEYQALMTRIASLGPDILYLGAIVNLNGSKLMQDMRTVMPADQVTFMGPDGLINQAFVDGAGDAAQGALITFGGLPPDALEGAGAVWADMMRESVNREPDAYSSYAFEAAVVVLQAIDQVGEKDRAAIMEAMWNTENFRGLSNTWSFTDTGDKDSASISVSEVIDGVITFSSIITPPE